MTALRRMTSLQTHFGLGWEKTRRGGEAARDRISRTVGVLVTAHAPLKHQSWAHYDTNLCHHRRITVSLEVEELVGHLFGCERVEHGHDPPCEFEV